MFVFFRTSRVGFMETETGRRKKIWFQEKEENHKEKEEIRSKLQDVKTFFETVWCDILKILYKILISEKEKRKQLVQCNNKIAFCISFFKLFFFFFVRSIYFIILIRLRIYQSRNGQSFTCHVPIFLHINSYKLH